MFKHIISAIAIAQSAVALLSPLPAAFNNSSSIWAYVSYNDPNTAVIKGAFNRSAFDAPFESTVTDPGLAKEYVAHHVQ